jgi:hypothetical protein
MAAISDSLRASALTDPQFANNLLMNEIFGSVQVVVLIATIFISVFRPWGKKKTTNG